ncbi:MAG: glucose-6-phosphate isomerase [Gemmatimonadota bacterium]
MSPVRVDPSNMLSSNVGGSGVSPDRLEGELADRFSRVHETIGARRSAGEIGFFDLPGQREAPARVQEVADSFGQWFESLVVVGIGGSSLGARAIFEALRGPFWNELQDEAREHFPRLYFLDNVDPDTTSALLGHLDLRRTLFNIVSKSGSTAETMAQFLVVEQALREKLGEEKLSGHLLFTTDPERGVLRELARERGIPALAVPPSVGGRFSVLSAVGLLPAAVVGVDVSELLRGAAEVEAQCRTATLADNPAGLLATLLHDADQTGQRPTHVFMPYGDRMRALALWFQQLWAESLGKALDLEGNAVHTGPTPIAALGAVDQHSLLQLLMEGPSDKVVCFVRVQSRKDPVEIPGRGYEATPALSYLGGHTLEELLDTERRATAEALRRNGRPSLTLEVERLDARALGGLFMLLQIATVYAGELYGVNPLDQPGVELGKELTYGLFGREGYPTPELG